jgi:beta-phosphoglucomutase
MSQSLNNYAVIFDMDGVIVDNMGFHKKAWRRFIQKHAPDTDLEEFSRHFGKTNFDLIRILLSGGVTRKKIKQLAEEKEALYRDLYAPYISPAPGLVSFLDRLEEEQADLVVATSAPPQNVDFVMNQTGLRKYFDKIVDSSQVEKGKPHPEIYRRAAALTHYTVSRCLVFEDSYPGIESARRAGIKVIGLATTHPAKNLKGAEKIISDFTEISPDDVRTILF